MVPTNPSKAWYWKSGSLDILEAVEAGDEYPCSDCDLDLAATDIMRIRERGVSCLVMNPRRMMSFPFLRRVTKFDRSGYKIKDGA
jgi:hypothetical protein